LATASPEDYINCLSLDLIILSVWVDHFASSLTFIHSSCSTKAGTGNQGKQYCTSAVKCNYPHHRTNVMTKKASMNVTFDYLENNVKNENKGH